MKNNKAWFWSILIGICLTVFPMKARAEFTNVLVRGAVSTATITSISVTTAPIIAISTGSGFFWDSALNGSGGGSFNFNGSVNTNATPGQYMPQRLYVEFFNDTSTDVWIGFNSSVSTQAGANYGRRIVPGTALLNYGQLNNYWVVASTTTSQQFVITQQR